ncbi:glycosyl hydrolase [Nocardioides sp. Root140]|uniref:glycosyl hydrolase n=1 Tax=Nocardioides sp. Root140 TaxID=1736460 RepID=UPI000AB3316D|nr:glycosyl hydrolase [Nocardioides sp. Root140]
MRTPDTRPASASRWLLAAALALTVVTPLTATALEPQRTSAAVSQPYGGQPAGASVAAGDRSFEQQLEGKYVDPDRVFSTDVRWWLGDASATDETLLEEIQALYDAGFRGVELCMQDDTAAPNDVYAYGTEMWTHKWNLMMNKLLDLGMGVYLTSGTNWSTSNVPGMDPASQSAMQNLTLGTGTVAPGQKLTALPAPGQNARKAGATFVSAYAYKVVNGNTVDPDSFIDLVPELTQGADVWTQNLDWTAPPDGTYRVFGLWTQGTYQSSSPSAEPSYATNYFDERGVDALRRFWEEPYLADPALRRKILDGDVQLFMDSLEMSTGDGFTWWAEDMAAEFKERKGYDITPYLFLVNGVGNVWSNPYHRVATAGTYKLDGDEDRRQRIINDWQDVMTQLYRERMLQPMKEWLNSVGIETRAQISYGQPIEMSEPAMDVDYPEAENRNQYNQVDMFRYWTGGAKLENKVLSSETTALQFAWNGTHQLRLEDAYSQFAAGMQRTIWHIWTSGFGYGNYQWPGYVTRGDFTLVSTRAPSSANYDELNAHLGRVQQLMQTGKSRADVGFVTQKFVHGLAFGGGTGSNNQAMNWQRAHQGIHYRSTELQDNGYTYDYFSPRFLFDDDVHFDQRTKTIEKAGYKAVVLYQDWLDMDGARRLLNWAKRGLKVVVLDDAASRTPFNDGLDRALKKVMDEMLELPTVRQATVDDDIDYFSTTPGGYSDNVLEKLQELGVSPYAGYSEPNEQLLSQTREDKEGNRYLYVYNYDDGSYRDKSLRPEVRDSPNPGTNIKTDIEMQGTFVPYTIDAWTGEATELAGYRWQDGKTVVPVDLDYNNIALMAFEKVSKEKLHIVSTDADSSYAVAKGVTVRATKSGEVTTELSNGKTYRDTVIVPDSYDITDWDLTVNSWRPSPTVGDLVRTETVDGVTTTNRKTSTVTTPINVELDTLKTWNDIPEVGKAVSGTGHYEATFDWDADAASGAYLDFGDSLEESMDVWINGRKVGGRVSTNPTKVKRDVGGVGKSTIDDGTGRQVPLVGENQFTGGVNWMDPVADISEYLVDGDNEIVIDYNSALANVQLDRGVGPRETRNAEGWWGYNIEYLKFGPSQAKIVPFADRRYP